MRLSRSLSRITYGSAMRVYRIPGILSLMLSVPLLSAARAAPATGFVDIFVSRSRGLRVAYDPALVERIAPGRIRAFTLWYYSKPFPLPQRPSVSVDKEIAYVEADCSRGSLRLLSRTQYGHKVGVDGRRYDRAQGERAVNTGVDAPAFRAILRALCHGAGKAEP